MKKQYDQEDVDWIMAPCLVDGEELEVLLDERWKKREDAEGEAEEEEVGEGGEGEVGGGEGEGEAGGEGEGEQDMPPVSF
jgi:hypothetical protein